MAKAKSKATNVPNRALYSRISYLYQAAAYLEAQSQQSSELVKAATPNASLQSAVNSTSPSLPLCRTLLSDLRNVSRKIQIRLSPAMKHTICKRCNTLLRDESTCSVEVENKSKGGKKPWADVLVRTCKICNLERRIPIGAERQKKGAHRSSDAQGIKIQKMEEEVS